MPKAAGDHCRGKETALVPVCRPDTGGGLLQEQGQPVQNILRLFVGEGQDLGLEDVSQTPVICFHHTHSPDCILIYT